MKKSLQSIEDFYINQGYRGDELRRILLKDREYIKLLKEKKRGLAKKISKKISLTKTEARKYVMPTYKDYEILSKVKLLEKQKLSGEDKRLVELIRTQLEHDWRKWLVRELGRLLSKYKIRWG